MAEPTGNKNSSAPLPPVGHSVGGAGLDFGIGLLGQLIPLLSNSPDLLAKALGVPALAPMLRSGMAWGLDMLTGTSGADISFGDAAFKSDLTRKSIDALHRDARMKRELSVQKNSVGYAAAYHVMYERAKQVYGDDDKAAEERMNSASWKVYTDTLARVAVTENINPVLNAAWIANEDLGTKILGTDFAAPLPTNAAERAVAQRRKDAVTKQLAEFGIELASRTTGLTGQEREEAIIEYVRRGGQLQDNRDLQKLADHLENIDRTVNGVREILGKNTTLTEAYTFFGKIHEQSGFNPLTASPEAAAEMIKGTRDLMRHLDLTPEELKSGAAMGVRALTGLGISQFRAEELGMYGMAPGMKKDFGRWGISRDEKANAVALRVAMEENEGRNENRALLMYHWMQEQGLDPTKALDKEDFERFKKETANIDVSNDFAVNRYVGDSVAMRGTDLLKQVQSIQGFHLTKLSNEEVDRLAKDAMAEATIGYEDVLNEIGMTSDDLGKMSLVDIQKRLGNVRGPLKQRALDLMKNIQFTGDYFQDFQGISIFKRGDTATSAEMKDGGEAKQSLAPNNPLANILNALWKNPGEGMRSLLGGAAFGTPNGIVQLDAAAGNVKKMNDEFSKLIATLSQLNGSNLGEVLPKALVALKEFADKAFTSPKDKK